MLVYEERPTAERRNKLVVKEARRPASETASSEHRGHDVFVSYSRADRQRVVELTQSLASRGKRAWVDLEDIPPSAEWMAEIRSAIEGADGYVVAVSPDVARSKVCSEELEIARAAGKRIVPVLVRPTDPDSVPQALAALNWIDATEGSIDAAADRVVQGLDTDLDHVKAHTRLLVRASEWDARSRPRSLLLRREDLKQAEALLVAAQGTEPAPTPVQARYVQASRQGTSRRQRAAVAIALCVALMAAALGVFAWQQRGEAIDQREAAEEQRRVAIEQRDIARSGDLSSASSAELGKDPELGLLLAIEASRIRRTDRSEEALRRALQASHVELVREGDGTEPADMAFGPEGDWVASADADSIDVWDVATGETIREIPTGEGAQAVIWGLAVDPTGRWIAAAARGGTRLWDATTGELVRVLPAKGIVYQVEFSTSGGRLVAGGDDGARVWNPATGDVVLELGREPSGTYGADVSADGDLIATGHGDGVVRVWDGRTGRLVHALRGHTDLGFFVGFSQHGDRLVSISFDNTARIWDAGSGRQLAVLTHETFVQDAAFVRDDFVVTADSNGLVQIWSVASGETVSELRGHSNYVSFLAVNPQQDRIVTGSDDETYRVWRPGPGVSTLDVDRPGYQTVAAYRPDGAMFLTAGYSGQIELWETTTGDLSGRLDVGDRRSVRSAAFSPDGSTIAVAARVGDPESEIGGGALLLMDAASGELLWDSQRDGSEAPMSVGFSPSGGEIATYWSDGTARIYDSLDGSEVAVYAAQHRAQVSSDSLVSFTPDSLVSFSPDGRLLAIADGSEVVLWDPTAGSVSKTFRHDDPVTAIAFSPDGSSLAAGSEGATIRSWDVGTGSLEVTMQGHRGDIESVAFSPDGSFLVSSADDGTARVWNADGEQIQVFEVGQLFVTSASFSPDGGSILVGVVSGEDTAPDVVEHDVDVRGITRIYSCDLCESFEQLLLLAESRVTRELTPEERATYLGASA
jgi:WD40 repeat protein